MLKPANPLKPEWYTPEAERDEATPTQFQLRPLSGVEQMDIEWWKTRSGNWRMTEQSARAALLHGLLDWKHFGDAQFNRVDRGANLALLDMELVDELATRIVLRSRLTDDEIKNLSSPPTSAPTESSSTADVAGGGGTATSETRQDSSSG